MTETEFTISRLAQLTGFRPGMIRYFERSGVITPATRTAAGYRLFGPHHVKELQFVSEMQVLGFYAREIRSLSEIRTTDIPLAEKREAIRKVFEEHARYVAEKASYFRALETRLHDASMDFVDRILKGDSGGESSECPRQAQ